MRLLDSEAQVLRDLLQCTLAALDATARRVAVSQSAREDGVAPLAHAGFVFEFVCQIEIAQDADHTHELTEAAGLHQSVEHAGLVANAHHHNVAATLRVGLGFDGRQYFLIVGAWRCAINELRLHGAFSGCDMALLTYAAKYLAKGHREESALCQSLHAAARSDFCAPLRTAAY